MTIKFEDVAAAALAEAPVLLAQWLGGHRAGHEWLGERKANGGLGDSWKVNLNTGAWAHFGGSGAKGGDLTSLYAAINHLDQLAALKQVAALIGVTDGAGPKTLPRTRIEAPEEPSEPIPEDAPNPEDHPRFGAPSALYRYGRAFWVARYDISANEKEFRPFTWRAGKWVSKGYAGLRPLYRLEELANRPEAPVLIVEGEKCADIAQATLKRYVVLTWAGGAQAMDRSDWGPLAGRDCIIWPDADEAGRKAAAWIAGHCAGARVRVIQPNGQAPGWDIADAVAEGMSPQQIAEWAKDHITDKITKPAATAAAELPPETSPTAAPKEVSIAATEESAEAEPAEAEYLPLAEHPNADDYPGGQPPQSHIVVWQSLPLAKDSKQIPHATLSNASLILQMHEEFKGKIWYDTFRRKIYHSLNGKTRLWTDSDSRRATAWIQQQLQLPKINLALVQDAVQHAAECNERNSLTEWLDSLEWDGQERLDTWLYDCLGTERNEYNDAVARNWPISMVARAYSPGCQVDTMPVIEGTMGRGKSKFLEILADPWFASIQIAFGEKDFFQAIQGYWLIEVPDMSGFSRREHTQILATITTRTDVYRKSHGRITEEYPRVTVFAATSETDDYLQDVRGRRRYWPLRCGEINLDALRGQREQIFAEAVVKYRAGASWHEMPDAAEDEQLARASRDLWTDRVLLEADTIWAEPNPRITSSLLLTKIGVLFEKQDDGTKGRITRIMKANGWVQKNNDGRHWKKIIRIKK